MADANTQFLMEIVKEAISEQTPKPNKGKKGEKNDPTYLTNETGVTMPQLNKILSKFAKGVVDLISDSRKIADEEIATLKEALLKQYR